MGWKRGNGEGSIYEHRRNGKKVGYRGAYTVYTSSGPKRRYVTGKTREEARQKLAKAMADRDGGLVFEDGGTTVGEYLERWLKDSVRGTVRNLCKEKLDGGLSSATVRKMRGVLQKALDQAVGDGLVPRNAAKGIRLPQGKKKEIRPLYPDEARALLEAARGDRLETLYVLAVSTGLREGELLALRWEDVDLEGAVLRVSQTLTRDGGKVSVGPPKTKNSRRTVGLTDGAVESLRGHLARQLEGMERMGSLYRPGGLVFANEVGGIVNPSNLRNRSLKALLKRAGLPPIRFHDLRHTCATLLLTRNVNPKIVSEMLGHASIAITLDTYSHVLPTMQQNAVCALEELLR